MQLEAVPSHPIASYLGEETSTHLALPSFHQQGLPSASSSPDSTAPAPSAAPRKTCSPDPSPAPGTSWLQEEEEGTKRSGRTWGRWRGGIAQRVQV